VLAWSSPFGHAADSLYSVIPDDALAVGVVHDLADVDRSIGNLVELVQAPPVPTLLEMGEGLWGVYQGIDEHGDLAVVFVSTESAPRGLVVLPVADFDKFFGGLGVQAPENGGIVEAEIQGRPAVVGRKNGYAVIEGTENREVVETFLKSKATLAADAPLTAWINANKASVVVTSHGMKALLPKLIEGIEMMQKQMATVGGENGRIAADMMNMYVAMFTAAQSEVAQFGVGVRIDPEQTVDILSRMEFKPDGTWARRFADATPCSDDLLAGVPDGSLVFAGGSIVPQGLMQEMMELSVTMMQSQPTFKLTPEQAEKFVDLSTALMKGVRAIGMRMGAGTPDGGLYEDAAMVMKVDDSKQYLEAYEKSIDAMGMLAAESSSPLLPKARSRRIKLDDGDALEVTMEMPDLQALMPAGAQNPHEMMKLFAGPDGTMKVYIAVADANTVIAAYTSPEKLKAAIDGYRSKEASLSKNPGVAKVSAALPQGSQAVMFVSVNGYAGMMRKFMAAGPGGVPFTIPEIPECSPVGMAVKASPSGVETHFVVPADVPKAIAETIMKLRAGGRPVPLDE
jgi:hypothetical protein